ncbi:MAG: hypothetical protein KKE17_03285 [Proteobacteria bacterium]|nr:hypothetical protein [Pseudomonadota bacterium]MBU1709007.1 hypothetical protein [Pseudomonadota bacterium]
MAKVCFLIQPSNDEKDVLDAMRSTLGLSVANHYSYGVVLDTELAKFDEYNAENLEWIKDMEGDMFTNVQANADKNGLTYVSIEELGQKLKEMDVIVPYGN